MFGYEVNNKETKGQSDYEGWGTALKPAVEPIIVAMKPLDGTYVENAQKHGVAGLNIDGSRIAINEKIDASQLRTMNRSKKDEMNGWGMNQHEGDVPEVVSRSGRWPANIIHDGSEEVVKEFPQTTSGAMKRDVPGYEGTSNTNFIRGKSGPNNQHGDSGSASRFFYCAKASREERELGLKNVESKKRDTSRKEGNPGGDNPRNRGVHKIKNNHPTVKPLSLMRYLCKLTKTPSGGVVLDPFMGSGTTGIACLFEGRDFIGIELEKEYFDLASNRIGHAEELRWEYEEISKKEEETINNKADQFFEFE
jgi:site-specific DNA-methyltransferase (adenine-specific)